MLARVPSRPNVQVHTADAACLPFGAGNFDVVSAYPFFTTCRISIPCWPRRTVSFALAGASYVDLEPNRHFWLNAMSVRDAVGPSTSALARDEVASVLQTSARVESEFGIPAEVFDLPSTTSPSPAG